MINQEPRLENVPARHLAGLQGRFTPATRDNIAGQWQRFSAHLGNIPGQVGRSAYGLCFMQPGGAFDYSSVVEVSSRENLPADLTSLTIPAGRYAVFAHHDDLSTICNTITKVWEEWLPASGHKAVQVPGAPCFYERYGERFNPATRKGDVEIWIPIES